MTERNLDDLAAFAVVAEERSFTRAAARLGMSTSNLSHTISKLERRLGWRLLERTSRSVSATPDGDRLLTTLGPALGTIEEMLATLQRGKAEVSGILRITATRQAYEAVIRPMLPVFLLTHPLAKVEVLIDYAYRDIVADRLDAGIRLGEKVERDMIALKVGPALRMAVVATPAFLRDAAPIRHPRDLLAHPCVNYRMVKAGTIYAWEFERAGRALELAVSGPLVFNEPQLMLEAVLDGLGIGYLLEHEVADHLGAGRLVRVLEDWTPPFPGFHLYHSSRHHVRPVLTAFIAALRARAATSPPIGRDVPARPDQPG
jgi:DNA-binding transcriptional LysR family regulator